MIHEYRQCCCFINACSDVFILLSWTQIPSSCYVCRCEYHQRMTAHTGDDINRNCRIKSDPLRASGGMRGSGDMVVRRRTPGSRNKIQDKTTAPYITVPTRFGKYFPIARVPHPCSSGAVSLLTRAIRSVHLCTTAAVFYTVA